MSGVRIAQPDVTLLLDMEGVIREATVSSVMGGEAMEAWLGRPFVETVSQSGVDKVRRMVEDARSTGISAFRQLTQRFPSGRELPMEYTTVLLGGRAGMLAIGKNLQAVAELQTQLIAAQQAMERDAWKLREVETRYRLLFDVSTEAIALLRAHNFRLLEANPAALRLLGLEASKGAGIGGRDFLAAFAPHERDAMRAMLTRVRENGKAPGVLVHLGDSYESRLARASLIKAEPAPMLLIQLLPAGNRQPGPPEGETEFLADLIERTPDAFAVIGRDGDIRQANRAFLDLAEVGAPGSVVGESLSRWLARPGADLAVLLAHLRMHGTVRLFSSAIQGELGTVTEVEISSAGNRDTEADVFGIFLRDVGRRLSTLSVANSRPASAQAPLGQVGRTPLRMLVKDAVGGVERHYIKAALDLARGNRTAAAELLGLSRQSLYLKLGRYGLDSEPRTSSDEGGE
jgi:transcriptional regulator PpsR